VLPAQKKSHRLTPQPKNGPIAGGGAADVAGAGCTGAITSGLFMKVFAQITKLQHDLVVSPTRNTDRRFLVRTVQRVTNPQRIALFQCHPCHPQHPRHLPQAQARRPWTFAHLI
jgi:hypothetical protein